MSIHFRVLGTGLTQTYDRKALEPVIEQMHGAGVWHNDLHARNVLRNRKGELRIVDFGQASLYDRGKDRWKEDFMG